MAWAHRSTAHVYDTDHVQMALPSRRELGEGDGSHPVVDSKAVAPLSEETRLWDIQDM